MASLLDTYRDRLRILVREEGTVARWNLAYEMQADGVAYEAAKPVLDRLFAAGDYVTRESMRGSA